VGKKAGSADLSVIDIAIIQKIRVELREGKAEFSWRGIVYEAIVF
jgi:hypothetical protein